jgi:3-hydroxyacyl-[acyl-carrier-protein] dehydratase
VPFGKLFRQRCRVAIRGALKVSIMRLEYFDMIDEIVELSATERRIMARAQVPLAHESPVFEGHFPGHPLVPGVLLTETMAQASGYLVLGLNKLAQMPFLVGVDKARFRSFVTPGTILEVEASIEAEGSGYAATKAKIKVNGKMICSAELRFALTAFPADMLSLMRKRVADIGLPMENNPS